MAGHEWVNDTIVSWADLQAQQESQLRFFEHFKTHKNAGNRAIHNTRTLTHNAVVLRRKKGDWSIDRQSNRFWEIERDTDAHVIILNYLDIEAIYKLQEQFQFPSELFATHLEKCEQHCSGDWSPSSFTSEPFLPSTSYRKNYISLDYRRPHDLGQLGAFERFEDGRVQRCHLLRSFHRAKDARSLYHHERLSMAWTQTQQSQGQPPFS